MLIGLSFKLWALIAGIVSAATSLWSGLAFVRAGREMPWNLRTFSGSTSQEEAFRRRASLWTRVGGAGLILSAATALLAAVFGYFS